METGDFGGSSTFGNIFIVFVVFPTKQPVSEDCASKFGVLSDHHNVVILGGEPISIGPNDAKEVKLLISSGPVTGRHVCHVKTVSNDAGALEEKAVISWVVN